MPLHFSQLDYQLPDGRTLFQNLSASLGRGVTALIGPNGVGKSALCELLAGDRSASGGRIHRDGALYYLPQHSDRSTGDVSQCLGLTQITRALERIASGDYSDQDLCLADGHWDLNVRLSALLEALPFAVSAQTPAGTLSGGQLARLRLAWAFALQPDVLILDEPDNHLDRGGRQWLADQLALTTSSVLLVSHDLGLLRGCSQIWQLQPKAIISFQGNYDDMMATQAREDLAVQRGLERVDRSLKLQRQQALRNEQSARQRARQGKKRIGSQPKVLLDAMRDKATKARQGRARQNDAKQEQLQRQRACLHQRQQVMMKTRFTFTSQASAAKVVRRLERCQLPFGSSELLDITLRQGQRVHLQGANGSGKSTLMKLLQGIVTPLQGKVLGKAPLRYLDQHQGLLDTTLSSLENLACWQVGGDDSERRTRLAGIGLRRNDALRPVSELSGGETMKVAMLLLSDADSAPFLLLDEPDNHLDLEAKQVLSQALNSYRGGYLLISHDAGFIETLSLDHRITLKGE
ncbi:ATP-binding cassette domain-containing protein [Ferrimonas kyonanensis]|uniref:ATP-binding cassette domain-containing protein n=1 Tax=Ferrimonas kyonanensis TaxID=364763 RepID=UPI000409441A|nr:ATP-binding cassette domain-containing protein [Ferrimonas kyonanensis]